MAKKSKNVTVVVLGDIGRSPRMQYHALSLSQNGHIVDIVGYGETEPMTTLKAEPMIFYHYLLSPPHVPLRLFNYIFKTIWQALSLLFVLSFIRTADVLIVQNPPAIPALIICWLYAKIVRAKFVIDWHNYAHSIMALNVGEQNVLTRITKKVESFFGKKADFNFCVTNAMKNDLKNNWNINATTLYDKPPKIFKTISLQSKHDFINKLGKEYKALLDDNRESVFTKISNGEIVLKANRPGLLVSSTSWTEDEDFSVLFAALQDFENHHISGTMKQLPNLICIITGKGHLKEYYCRKIAESDWKHVFVITPWLESEDYPLVLACADLGVSLHTSSSGLDLPMKVVDMFGCELPVCAFDFNCLNELVKHERNSYKFKSSEELSSQIKNWFDNFPNNEKQRETERKFKAELNSFQNLRWDENWNNVASPVFS